jgi:hypothetical protein
MAKRKAGARYANGRLKKPTIETLKQLEAQRYRENMQQAAQQPHRREFADPLDPWLENELGRFCRRNGLRREYYQAGLDWAEMRASWNAAKGVPASTHKDGMGSGRGPSEATLDRWKHILDQIDEDLYEENAATLWATRKLCIDMQPPKREFLPYVIKGLGIVALRLGKVSAKDHPFGQAA